MDDFRGKAAVVTGAASGIGLGLARRFAAEGMRVVLADVEEQALDAAVAELRAAGGDAIGVAADVSSPDSVEALAREAVRACGAVHVVCNNAGVAVANDWASLRPDGGAPLWELTPEDWRWTWGVNVLGVVHGIRSFVPILLAQGEPAHVVNTGSVLSFHGGADLAAYGASKFAVGRVTEALHLQLAARGAPVRAHLLCPGGAATRSYLAERNRPPALRNPDPPPAEAPLLALARERTGARMERLMSPDAVAARALEGLRAGRFYIFTHGDEADAAIRARADRILAREHPVA